MISTQKNMLYNSSDFLGILAIHFLADLTRTFSRHFRQTFNPPYVPYMVNYQISCLFVSFIPFFFKCMFYVFIRSADVWTQEQYSSSVLGLYTIIKIYFDRRPITEINKVSPLFSLVDIFA